MFRKIAFQQFDPVRQTAQHEDIIGLDDVFCLFVRQIPDEIHAIHQGAPDFQITGCPKAVPVLRFQSRSVEQFYGQGRDMEFQQGGNKVRVATPSSQGSGQTEQKVMADGEFRAVFMQTQIHHVVLLG